MSNITDSQGVDLSILDTGFAGDMLCGKRRFQNLSKCTDLVFKEIPNSGVLYSFGNGNETASGSYEVTKRGARTNHEGRAMAMARLDVVPNDLPLISGKLRFDRAGVGLRFGGGNGNVSVDVGDSTDFGRRPVPTKNLSGLPNAKLSHLLEGIDTVVKGEGVMNPNLLGTQANVHSGERADGILQVLP